MFEMLGSEIGIRSEGMERNGGKKQKRTMLVSGKLAERWSKILVVRIVGEL